jgi:hypothetical protein
LNKEKRLKIKIIRKTKYIGYDISGINSSEYLLIAKDRSGGAIELGKK